MMYSYSFYGRTITSILDILWQMLKIRLQTNIYSISIVITMVTRSTRKPAEIDLAASFSLLATRLRSTFLPAYFMIFQGRSYRSRPACNKTKVNLSLQLFNISTCCKYSAVSVRTSEDAAFISNLGWIIWHLCGKEVI